MSQVVSFAEESCWDGEQFRTVRREIVFVIRSLQIKTPDGEPIYHEFRADFGIFYDIEDDWLIEILAREIAGVQWGWYVYHKKIDHSGIDLIHPETGKVLGSIQTRGGAKQKLSGEILGANIVPIVKGKDYRAARLQRETSGEEKGV